MGLCALPWGGRCGVGTQTRRSCPLPTAHWQQTGSGTLYGRAADEQLRPVGSRVLLGGARLLHPADPLQEDPPTAPPLPQASRLFRGAQGRILCTMFNGVRLV